MHKCCDVHVGTELCNSISYAVPTEILLSKEEMDKLEVFDDSDTDSKWEAYPTETLLSKVDTDNLTI